MSSHLEISIPFGGSGVKPKFCPAVGNDTTMINGAVQQITTNHQCITSMREYRNISFEELRMQDYAAGRVVNKPKASGSSAPPVTGSPPHVTGSPPHVTGSPPHVTGSPSPVTESPSSTTEYSPPRVPSATSTLGGVKPKFCPSVGYDTTKINGIFKLVTTNHQCITSMREYENLSFEELRMQDYAAGRVVNQPEASGSSPPPVTESPPPVTESLPPVTESPPPVTESPPPVTESPPPVTESPPPVTESPPPVTESPSSTTEYSPPRVPSATSNSSVFDLSNMKKSLLPDVGSASSAGAAPSVDPFLNPDSSLNHFDPAIARSRTHGLSPKFCPTIDSDMAMIRRKMRYTNTMHQCITSMKEYSNMSFEELRMQDYAVGRVVSKPKASSFFPPPVSESPSSFSAPPVTESPFSFSPPPATESPSSTTECRPSLVPSATSTSAVSSDPSPTSGTSVVSQVIEQEKCDNSVNIKVFGKLTQSPSSPNKYTWAVNGLPMRTDVYGIESPEICHGLGRWCLCLYPNGLPENRPSDVTSPPVNQGDHYVSPGDMVLAVVPKNTVLLGFYGQDHWKIDVRLPNKTLLKSFRSKKTFAGGKARCRYFVLPFEVVKQVYHSADQCSLIFEMISETGTETVVETSSQATLTSGIDRLAQDLEDMLASGYASDATIRVKGQKDFRVHRNILVVRMPVFASMFKDQLSENTTDIINVEDCEPDTFQRFLQYVYTGRVEDLSPKNACDLYQVARKYQMDSLKLDCLEYINCNLSVESLFDALALAQRHGEKELTELAMKFFTNNISEVIVTVEWQNFLRENPIQANELLINAHPSCKKSK